MKYKILSVNRNRIRFIIGTLPVILFVTLAIMDIYGFYINKIFLLIICVYILLPISIIKCKFIGVFELNEQYISFITQQNECIKLNFTDIKSCKLNYIGAKGNLHLMLGGWSWDPGDSFFEIQTNERVYKITFLSESLDDDNKFIKYTEVLKRNNIPYSFSIKNRKYISEEK